MTTLSSVKTDIASLFYKLGAMSSAQETELKAVAKEFATVDAEINDALDACAMASGTIDFVDPMEEGAAMMYAMETNMMLEMVMSRLPEGTHNVIGCAMAGITSRPGITEAQYDLLTGPFIKVFGKFGV